MSVIIPVYNCERYIAESVDSVLNQTFGDFELLVVNDGSTDGTGKVLDRFGGEPRFIRIDQENKRMSGARNAALKIARGEYVAFLDSDDLWRADKLEKQVRFLDANPSVGYLFSNSSYYYGEGDVYGDSFSFQAPHRGRVTEKLLFGNFISILTVMLRRSLFEKEEPFRERFNLCADMDLHLRMSVHCDFDYLDEPLALYRVHPENASRNYPAAILEARDLVKDFLERHPEVAEENPRVFRAARPFWEKELGYAYLTGGETKKARECYLEYCRRRPLHVQGWAAVLLSFFGPAPFRALGIHGKSSFMNKEHYDIIRRRKESSAG